MGMSSSQARLLTLTGRMHDIEYKAQRIEAQKLQMANESRRVYEDYLDALDKGKFVAKSMQADGSFCDVPFTANTIYSYGQFSEQLALTSPKGQVYIPSGIHNNYQNSSNLEEFLANYVDTETIQREVHTVVDNEPYVQAKEEYDRLWAIADTEYRNSLSNWEIENNIEKLRSDKDNEYSQDFEIWNTGYQAWIGSTYTSWENECATIDSYETQWNEFNDINTENALDEMIEYKSDGTIDYNDNGTLKYKGDFTDAQKNAIKELVDWANKYPEYSIASEGLAEAIANTTADTDKTQAATLNDTEESIYYKCIIDKSDVSLHDDFYNNAFSCYNTAVRENTTSPACFLHVLSHIISYNYDTNAETECSTKYTELITDLKRTLGDEFFSEDEIHVFNNRPDKLSFDSDGFLDLNGDGSISDAEKDATTEIKAYCNDVKTTATNKFITGYNTVSTTTGDNLEINKGFDGSFTYYGLYMVDKDDDHYIINHSQEYLAQRRESFKNVSDRIEQASAFLSTDGITIPTSKWEKLSCGYTTNEEGKIVSKNLKQWAIDLYYLYTMCENSVGSENLKSSGGQSQEVTLAYDTESYTFKDVQSAIIKFYDAMGNIDITLDSEKYNSNRNNAKSKIKFPFEKADKPTYSEREPQRSDSKYDIVIDESNKPQPNYPDPYQYHLQYPKTRIEVTVEDFASLADPEKAQWYVNLWAKADGRDEAPVLDVEVVHDDATNTDKKIYSVQSYNKSETNYSTNEQTQTPQNENYIVIPDDMMESNSWIYNVVNGGFALIQRFDDKEHKFSDTSPAVMTEISEVSDEVELRKAEAKYEADMKRIDLKDRKYDTDLAALDNERNAIKQEIETLKTVAKDNVERTFRLFS